MLHLIKGQTAKFYYKKMHFNKIYIGFLKVLRDNWRIKIL